jgi:hypothetical protein
MPAMRELVTNAQLFQVLLSMLSGNSHHHGEGEVKPGRKRSPSEDSTFNVKKKQMLATPPSTARPQLNSVRQISQSSLTGTNASTGTSDSAIQVFAATILYCVLQHMDHWPVQLMSKYAEDAFGLRTWVDNELCKDIVANLELSLDSSEPIDEATSLIADEVESYFSSLASRAQTNDAEVQSVNRVTIASHHRTPSAKEVRAQSRHSETSDDSSSSGEEEILESNSIEVDPITPHNKDAMSTNALEKLFQRNSHFKQRVRSRYVGHNLDLAFEAISDALADRLGNKSKQNSRLLQTLPRFLCIPRVRCLSSRHLDRWLQSPALAALARYVEFYSSSRPPKSTSSHFISFGSQKSSCTND